MDDLLITSGENVLIIDNGCDQSIVNINAFLIETHLGVYYTVGGALNGMQSSNLELVNNAYTLVPQESGDPIILRITQAFLDSNENQFEALLQPHQARAFSVAIDDVAKQHNDRHGNPGGQCIVADDQKIDLHFDGWKCYLRLRKPSPQDLQRYRIIDLTSPRTYEPQHRLTLRRIHNREDVSVDEWRKRLGFLTFETTKKALENTSQMIQIFQAETREYLPDYYKTRVWALRLCRINDVMYSDTFFSSVASVRGFTMMQMFAFKQTKFSTIKLMRRESQAPEMYEDIFREIGAPNRTVVDNANALNGKRWTNINRRYCIETGNSVPHHQHQNYCEGEGEGEGGNFKFSLLKLFHNTPHAPIQYWCYGASFLDKCRRCLSKTAQNDRCSSEVLTGETKDISRFRFWWFQPVWYYSPGVSFPKAKMEPGFFLDLAENTGDRFDLR